MAAIGGEVAGNNRHDRAVSAYERAAVPYRCHKIFILLAVCGAAACAVSTGSGSNKRAERKVPTADAAQGGHADVDLTGAWATGGAGEPAAERIVLRVECNYSPALWIIQQSGDTVRAWAIPASRAQGIATSQPVSTVAAEGRVSGVELTMGIAGARYVLRYDSTSGHLRGTLNGAPFWAVRQDIVRPDNCLPVP
jgi:hypothetical protein